MSETTNKVSTNDTSKGLREKRYTQAVLHKRSSFMKNECHIDSDGNQIECQVDKDALDGTTTRCENALVEEATNMLIFLNGGPGCNVEPRKLEQHISQVVKPISVEAHIVANPYALVQMASVDGAKRVREFFNNKVVASLGKRALLVEFTKLQHLLGSAIVCPCPYHVDENRCIVTEGNETSHTAPNTSTNALESLDLHRKYRLYGTADIPGLYIVPNFVSAAEESALIEELDKDNAWERLEKRRVQHFGHRFVYGENSVSKEDVAPPPLFMSKLLHRMHGAPSEDAQSGKKKKGKKGKTHFLDNDTNVLPVDVDGAVLPNYRFDQLTVNDYEPNGSIPPHVDVHTAFADTIVSLTLNSHTIMDMRMPQRNAHIALLLPRRSLLILRGDSRFAWTHGIGQRRFDMLDGCVIQRGRRVSLTFRQICDVSTPCHCSAFELCNNHITTHLAAKTLELYKQHTPTAHVPANCDEPSMLESTHVTQVYERIAEHFSATRYRTWPKVDRWLCDRQGYGICADVGCGNGKYLHVNESLVKMGSDVTHNLLKICVERGFPHLQVASALRLPYRDSCFDCAISIAVVHHFASPERRAAAISEMCRIVKPGGHVLVYVWAKEQKRFVDTNECDVFVRWRVPRGKLSLVDKEKSDAGGEGEEHQRYYHLFERYELSKLVNEHVVGGRLSCEWYDFENWCVEIEVV